MKKRKTLMRSVAKTRRAWNNFVKDVAMEEGIPDSYRPVLMYLLRHPGSGQRNIADFAGITTSAVNQAVKNMLEEDFLVKETDNSDKRNSKLYLTEKGASIAERVFEKLDAADDAITKKIGAKKEADLIVFLDEITEYIRRDLSQC